MLCADNLCKRYVADGVDTPVLKGVSLSVGQGDFLSIVGRSGSGKTTLLHVLSTLMAPDSGIVTYRGDEITILPERLLNRLRRTDFAVIFQFHHLLPYLTALENTLLPFMTSLAPVSKEKIQRAEECLNRVGLSGKYNSLPGQLSGGEQQRVAIARALVKSPTILFADEPTGSLDKNTGHSIMDLLEELNRDGLTVVMVTHDPEYAHRAGQVLEMEDGRLKVAA
jgi:ABC-type lipoprotein export system ATPase subunit